MMPINEYSTNVVMKLIEKMGSEKKIFTLVAKDRSVLLVKAAGQLQGVYGLGNVYILIEMLLTGEHYTKGREFHLLTGSTKANGDEKEKPYVIPFIYTYRRQKPIIGTLFIDGIWLATFDLKQLYIVTLLQRWLGQFEKYLE